jgi:intraflagellar transport protein 172
MGSSMGAQEEARKKYLEAASKGRELAEKLSHSPEKRRQVLLGAAQDYRKAGEWEQAISLYNRLEEWVRAGDCCREAGIHSIAAQFFEKGQAWDRAAAAWEQIGRWGEARRCWEQARQRGHAERCRVKEGISRLTWAQRAKDPGWGQTADYFERQKEWFSAARYWLLAGRADKAAKCGAKGRAQEHENSQRFTQAGEEWGRAGEWERAAQCWEKVGQGGGTASAWGNAARAWENADKWEKAAESWEKAEQWESAAEAWEIAHKWEKAIQCWKKSTHKEKEFHLRCCNAFLSEEKRLRAQEARQIGSELMAHLFEDEGIWDAAARSWEEIYKWEEAARCWEKAEEWEKAARCWEGKGDRNAANRCKELASLKNRIGQISS